MLSADLLNLDFAALRTLRLVYRLNSFSAAADELGVKQSSVSYTVDRLRKALGDPLFVRQGGRIAPTARCIEVVQGIDHILSAAEDLAAPAVFEPSTATGNITLMCNYYSRMTFLGDVVRRLRDEAPGVTLHLTPGFHAIHALMDGRADMAITPVPQEASGIYQKQICDDVAVCMMDPANPLARGRIDIQAYSSANHVQIDFGPGIKTVMQREIDELSIAPNAPVTLPDPASLPNIIRGTDLVATIPSRFATLFREDLAIVPAPIVWRTNILLFWPARLDRSPLHRWLRGIIADAAAAMKPPEVG